MAYDNTNTGMMYRNEKKESASHPEFTGFINIEGVEYWLSGWVKEGKSGGKMAGKKFFSLAFKSKDGKKPVTTPEGDDDDEIPF